MKRADEQRIATRADAAARVGEIADERDELMSKLAELTKTLSGAVGEALTVMTADELAQFIDRQRRQLEEWTTSGQPNARRRPSANRPDRPARQPARSARPTPTPNPPHQPANDPSAPASATESTGKLDTALAPTPSS